MNKTFILEGVSIACDHSAAFDYLSDRYTLPAWTKGFKNITAAGAIYETPAGVVSIGLDLVADRKAGVIDWIMTFPDGDVARAYARAIPESAGRTNVQFFFAPQVASEALPAVIDQLSGVIREEFEQLKALLEAASGARSVA